MEKKSKYLRYINYLWIIAPILKFLDFLTTNHILVNEGRELNPFVENLIINFGIFLTFFLFFAVIVLLSYIQKIMYDKNLKNTKIQKLILFGYFAFCFMNLYPVLYNLSWVI